MFVDESDFVVYVQFVIVVLTRLGKVFVVCKE